MFERFLTLFILDDRPVFDEAKFEFIAVLENNHEQIKTEIVHLMETEKIPDLAQLSSEQKRLVTGNSWKSLMLKLYGVDIALNQKKTPITTAIFKEIPNVTTVFFSILEPQTSILPHRGPYKGVLRCHLAILVPTDSNLCWLQIHDQKYYWKESKCIVFDDTYVHEAHNCSQERRVVLFVDFLRDFPFPISLINRCFLYMIRISPFIQRVLNNVEKNH